jgi:hypothetical protein
VKTAALVLAVVMATMATGCVSTKATVLDHGSVKTELDPKAVKIYRTAEAVPGRYEEIALLNSKGDSLLTNERRMMESMRKKAAALGANGVILDAVSEPSMTVQVVARIFNTSTDRKGKALAIFVLPEGQQAEAAPVFEPAAPAPAPVAVAPASVVAASPGSTAPVQLTVVVEPSRTQAGASFLDDRSGVAALPPPPAKRPAIVRTSCQRDAQGRCLPTP